MSAAMLILLIGGYSDEYKTKTYINDQRGGEAYRGADGIPYQADVYFGSLPCFKAGKKYLISEEALMKAVFGHYEPEGGDAA